VGAVVGVLVVAPVAEVRVVAEAAVHDPLVGDLAHPLDPEWLPRHVLRGVPSVRPAGHALPTLGRLAHGVGPGAPRMTLERVLPQRLDLTEQALPYRRGHPAPDPDVVEDAFVVVETEQQRAHAFAVLVHAEARGHALA